MKDSVFGSKVSSAKKSENENLKNTKPKNKISDSHKQEFYRKSSEKKTDSLLKNKMTGNNQSKKSTNAAVPTYADESYSFNIKSEKEKRKAESVKTTKQKKEEAVKLGLSADDIAYEDELLKVRKDRKRQEFQQKRNKVISIIMILACVYVVFLIYGAFNTQYVYDDNGNAVPQKLDVQQLKDIKEFDKIANQYRQARQIYEEVLILDYRVGAGIEDTTILGAEYEKELDAIETLTLQLGGVSVITEYSQLLTMLTSWVSTDIAVYCQNMSAAISYNNEDYMNQALEYKNISYSDFSLITKNLVTFGEQIEGADISDITSWSPESYISQESGGIY